MKILLVDAMPVMRRGVRALLDAQWPGLDFDEADSLSIALKLLEGGAYDLVLLDPTLPDAEGLEAVPRLMRLAPTQRVLVFSAQSAPDYANRVLGFGVAGFLSKFQSSDDLVQSVQRILAGGRYISPAMAEYLADLAGGKLLQGAHALLSAQEYRVMLLLVKGMRVTSIARQMYLSPKTISTYRTRILEKLDLASNADLVRYAVQQGLKP